MRIVGVQGLTGGSGATTVCAGLAVAMNNFGTRSIALDLQLDNCLGAHFGMPLAQSEGLLPLAAATATSIEECVFESDQGYPFIPFGRVLPEHETEVLALLGANLNSILAPLLGVKDRVLFIDVPRTAGSLQQWVYEHADVMINVLQPEPRLASALLRFATHTLPQQQGPQASTNTQQHPHSKVLINQMAPNLTIARDSSDYLHGVLHSSMLLPVAVHRDQHAVEAFAAMQPVSYFQKSAQISRDFDALALWLAGFLAETSGRAQASTAPSSAAETTGQRP